MTTTEITFRLTGPSYDVLAQVQSAVKGLPFDCALRTITFEDRNVDLTFHLPVDFQNQREELVWSALHRTTGLRPLTNRLS